jgi:putative Mg2+ transporter-C (MgtC) family protein
MPSDLIEPAARLLVAMLAGMVLGLDRDLRGKPTGVRTLGLVAFSSALVAVAMIRFFGNFGGAASPQLLSNVAQGLVQGVLTGIGFIGAGVILREAGQRIHGLTTAATVWVTAVIGLACGLGDWGLVSVALILVVLLLIFGGSLERQAHRLLGGTQNSDDHEF